MNLFGLLFRSILQLQVRNKSLADLIQRAQSSGESITERLTNSADTPQIRQQMRHIIGIERWGQRRLKTMLGEAALHDEFDGYQPASDLDTAALRETFQATRAETLAIVAAIQQRGIAETAKAYHNNFGELSLNLWLRYLTLHANFESRAIK